MSARNDSVRDLLGSESRVPPRRSLADEAADQLRELILLERLRPGLPVPERDLAEGLGISRTPLREALRILEGEGLIEYSPTRRPHVADPSIEEISENLAVLGALEGLAGELACRRATAPEVARVERLASKMEAGSDRVEPLAFFGWDMEFHRTVVEASRNRSLIRTHRQYNARLWRARFISSRMRTRRSRTLRQHREIAAALQARDCAAASQALRQHMTSAIDNVAGAQDPGRTREAEN